MQTHPANPVVYIPPCGPDVGAWNTVLSVEVQSVATPVVMSWSLVWDFLFNVPIALNETVPPVGTLLGTLVLVAAAPGVNVGVAVALGVLPDVGLGVGVADAVAEGATSIVIAARPKPGVLVAVGLAVVLPPVQLNRIAPETNPKTGVTTSHLSHRNNMKASPMTDADARCQGDAQFLRLRTRLRSERN